MSMQQQEISQHQIIQCFRYLYSSDSSSHTRKAADKQLMDYQANPIALLSALFGIFQTSSDPQLKFQSLVYACSVLKRNWTQRRYNKEHSIFEGVKREIRKKLLEYIMIKDRQYLVTLFDMTKFILKVDFPHNFPDFTSLLLKLVSEIDLSDMSIIIFKELREMFQELGQRKAALNKKHFQENIWQLLRNVSKLSANFRQHIENGLNQQNLCKSSVKLSKYCDQIILAIMRITPAQLLDTQFASQLMNFLLEKLQFLLTRHNTASSPIRAVLQKNIKSLIYSMGLLQMSRPLALSWILTDFYNCLRYVIANCNLFTKSATVRYSLIGLKRIIKQFAFYAEDGVYISSIKNKATSANHIQLRKICNNFYAENITENTVQDLFKFLLFTPIAKTAKEEHCLVQIEDQTTVEKGRQKQLSLQACVISLLESLLQRFTFFTQSIVKNMISALMQNNWQGVDSYSLSNIFSVLALLPATCKKNQLHNLQDIPVLQILQFIYTQPTLRLKFASVVSGWLEAFTNQQVNGLTDVLISFIQSQGSRQQNEEVDVLMGCCHCLNKVVTLKGNTIDLAKTIQKVVPVALLVFQNVQNPQVLWPMVTLVSNIILKVEFNTQLIVRSIDSHKLSLIVSNRAPVLVQALCDMFKSFLCVIPRNMSAQSVYQVICFFLNNHLGDLSNPNYQKIFHLWYIAIRQYSPVQKCDNIYIDLFYTHFRKNMHRKTATLVYILQEYMLSCLLPDQPGQFVKIVADCYNEADDLQKQQRDKLKIAALSFQITLITRYSLEQVNSDTMLKVILQDLCSNNELGSTVRNSLLSIVNRYIILHRDSFFGFINSVGLPFESFYQGYFSNMQHLTSHAAAKINAVALLSLFNVIDSNLIINKFNVILKLIIPQVQNYYATLHAGNSGIFTGKVQQSPSLRFASNILSQRKQQIRRKDAFESINLGLIFRQQFSKFSNTLGATIQQLSQILGEQTWIERLLKLL